MIGKRMASTDRFVALDLETAVSYDHIIEIGAVEIVASRKTGRKFYSLVRPPVPHNIHTVYVHGLIKSRLEREPRFADIADEFMAFIGDAHIIAHAEYYERNTLQKELARIGLSAPDRSRFVCTLQMARESRRFPNNKLETICRELGIVADPLRDGFHDALSDAHMAADVYVWLSKEGRRETREPSRRSNDATPRASHGARRISNRVAHARYLLHVRQDVSAYMAHIMESLALRGHR